MHLNIKITNVGAKVRAGDVALLSRPPGGH